MYVSSTDFCRRAGERRRFALFYLLVALCTTHPLVPVMLHLCSTPTFSGTPNIAWVQMQTKISDPTSLADPSPPYLPRHAYLARIEV
jgi:hypothetical protein